MKEQSLAVQRMQNYGDAADPGCRDQYFIGHDRKAADEKIERKKECRS